MLVIYVYVLYYSLKNVMMKGRSMEDGGLLNVWLRNWNNEIG